MSSRSLAIELHDRDGIVRSRLDFSKLGIHESVAHVLLDSYKSQFSHNTLETRRQIWRAIRKLALCLENIGYKDQSTLPKTTLIDFRDWLSKDDLSDNTAHSLFNIVRSVLQWCERNTQLFAGAALEIPVTRVSRRDPQASPVLDDKQISVVLSKCYGEIREIEQRIELGRRLKLGEFRAENEAALGAIFKAMLDIGHGVIPSQRAVAKTRPGLNRKINRAGGYAYMSRLIFLSPEDIFPFYLAILIQTAGNPSSIRELRRDCIQPHTLTADRETIIWYKNRSAAEQKADFNSVRSKAAPNLVRQLNTLTRPITELAAEHEKKYLFLARGKSGISLPVMQLLHVLLNNFITRHDLPNFTFKQLRKTSAVLHYKTSRDPLIAKSKLNHQSLRSTFKYLSVSSNKEDGNELIAHFQGKLMEICMLDDLPASHQEDCARSQSAHLYQTVFGFDCEDPFSGVAPKSSKGKICQNFFHCATCPGAVVTLDDPIVVAKLLKAEKTLQQAEKQASVMGWAERFDSVYLPILRIIQNDLLSRISSVIIEKASTIKVPELPRLE